MCVSIKEEGTKISIEVSNTSFVNIREVDFINSNLELGFLPIEVKQFNEEVKLIYDVENRITLMELLKRGIGLEEAYNLIGSLNLIFEEQKNIINIRKMVLEPEYIYVQDNSLNMFFIYTPIMGMTEAIDEEIRLRSIITLILNSIKGKSFLKDKLKYSIDTLDIKGILRGLKEELNKNSKNIRGIEGKKLKGSSGNLEDSKGQGERPRPRGEIVNEILFFIQIIALLAGIYLKIAFDINLNFLIIVIVITIFINIYLYFKTILKRKKTSFEDKKAKEISGTEETGKAEDNDVFNETVIIESGDETIILEENAPYLEYTLNGTLEKIELNRDRVVIGRSREGTDVRIENKTISKLHAEVLRIEDAFYIKDIGSSNGTFINGRKLQGGKNYKLSNNDVIKLADFQCTYREWGDV